MIMHSLKGLQGSKGIFIQQEKISVIKNTTGFFLICKERLDEKVKYLSPEVDERESNGQAAEAGRE